MSSDTKSTVMGAIMACVIAAAAYFQTGADPENPMWWVGLIIAVATAIKGYYHNKPKPDAPKEAA